MAIGEELWKDPDVLAALERASLQALAPRQPVPAVRRPPALATRQPQSAPAPPVAPAAPARAPVLPEALEVAVQPAVVGLAMLDAEHLVTWVNAAACVLFDRLPGEVLGAVPDFLAVAAGSADIGSRSAEIWTPLPDHGWRECHGRRPDGTEFMVLVHSSAVPGVAGRPGSYLLQLVDPARAGSGDAHLPLTDPLTGLPSQALLIDRLQHALARSERNGSVVAVVRLRFELDAADSERPAHMSQVLLAASRRLRSALRDTDTVARAGDDGFTLVCEEIAESEVQTVFARVIEGVSRFNIDGRLTPVTVRSGVAIGRGPGSTSSLMMAEAEAALA
jgi:GGDEF domain-containing protein/PAS domain-containing protein